MSTRKIIKIDEAKCDGCGLCAKACAEGAIAIVDGKAKLISETYCDGLGACLGKCPQDAITIEERAAAAFDERAVHEHLARQTQEKAKSEKLPCGCPGTMARSLDPRDAARPPAVTAEPSASELRNWPVQLKLVPPSAPYFDGARLLIASDCVPFAFPDFHRQLLRDRILLVGCPKLDDAELYRNKLAQIFRQHDIRSVEVAYMEVPCCFGMLRLVTQALADAGKAVPLTAIKIGIRGEICESEELHPQSNTVN